ncbi:hypothetical protein EON64_06235 [archaeon]|nr:MAG: hypothetical protein EON64_06235 [archaeon]
MQASDQYKVIQRLEQVDSDLTSKLESLEQANARLEENIRLLRSYLAEKRYASSITVPDVPIQTSQAQSNTNKEEEGVSSSSSVIIEASESTEDKLNRILNLAKQIRTPTVKSKRDTDETSVTSSSAQSTSTHRSTYRTMSMASATARKPESLRSAFLKSVDEVGGVRPPQSPENNKSASMQSKHAIKSSLPAPPTLPSGKEESVQLRSVKQQLALLRTRRPLLHSICHIIVSCHVSRTNIMSTGERGSLLLRALVPHYEVMWDRLIARGQVKIDLLQQELEVAMRAINTVVESKHYRRTEQEVMQLMVLWYRVMLLQFIMGSALQQATSFSSLQITPTFALQWNPLSLNTIYLVEKMKNTNNMDTLLKIKQKWKQVTRQRLATHFVQLQAQAVTAAEDMVAEICLAYVKLWLQQLRTSKRHSVSDEMWKNALMYLRSIANVLLHQGKKANCIRYVSK